MIESDIYTKTVDMVQQRFRYTDTGHEFIAELMRLCIMRELDSNLDFGENEPFHVFAKEQTEETDSVEPFDLTKQKIVLPSLPIIFTQFVDLMGRPESSAADFADVIRLDPPLAARLLKLVNSSFYGLRHRVDTVTGAVSVVGIKALYAMVLSMSVVTAFKGISEKFVDLPMFWAHSIASGVIAKKIAEYKKYPEGERFFVAGLLHDIGRLIIFNYLSFRASEAFTLSWNKDEMLFHSESRVLEHDHAKLGGLLLKFWKLPDILVDMVMFHHSPRRSRYKKEVAVIHVADMITNGMRIGSSGERYVHPLDMDAWQTIDMPTTHFQELFEILDKDISDIIRIVTPRK